MEKDLESKAPVVITRSGRKSKTLDGYQSDNFLFGQQEEMDPHRDTAGSSTSTQREEPDAYKHPAYLELLQRLIQDAKGIKFSNDKEGARNRELYEYNLQTDREALINELKQQRQKREIKQMFENLTFEDFEKLKKRAIKSEQPDYNDRQQIRQTQGHSASGPMATINNVNYPKNARVKVFKGKQRVCDTHWIPGPHVIEWLESVEDFFKAQNEMDDATKIRWLTSFTSEREGNAQELIWDITDEMRDRPYDEVKNIIIHTFAGTPEYDFINLSTDILRPLPQINNSLEVAERIIMLRKHVRRIVASYLRLPKFKTRSLTHY